MLIYKTTHTDANGATLISWQSSQTEARMKRVALKAEGHKAESSTVNIPTGKGPLIEWLNENITA